MVHFDILPIMRPLHNKHIHSFLRFFIGKANFCRTIWIIQKSLTKHMGNLIKPVGKPIVGQSFLRKILELPTGSPSDFSKQISPNTRLL